MKKCGKCKQEVPEGTAEICFWCEGPMCCACWERYGHCGHADADLVNEASDKTDAEGRLRIVNEVIRPHSEAKQSPDLN